MADMGNATSSDGVDGMAGRMSPATGSSIALLTALAYAVVGWVALKLAIPPSYAAARAVLPATGAAGALDPS